MISFRKHKKFKLIDIDAGHHHVTYKNVYAKKCPFDYVLYQMLIAELKPDLIIEIGTNKGGSALYFADLLELNRHGELHTIDLPENNEDVLLHSHSRIKIYKQGYSGYDTTELKGFNKVMVIDDGSHLYEDVLATLEKFSPFVTTGSYFIVEDGIITELGLENQYNGGPQKAIREFLKKNMNFETDRKWCDFFGPNATFNVNGYLKKNILNING
jgi:cephalosporin hydroxylase